MQIKATDKHGQTHTGKGIKGLFVSEDNGNPLAIIKETIVGDLKNYKILTPGDKEFDQLVQALGFNVAVVKI